MRLLTCNGQPVDADLLSAALVNYGHFTSLQVRGMAVQGLDLHLARLQAGTRALFDSALDLDAVRGWMDAALDQAGRVDASLRVTVIARQFDFRNPLASVPADVLVSVGAPVQLTTARRVRTVVAVRDWPELKHVGTFGLFAQRRAALADGADDALLVGWDDRVSEGSTWNIAVHDGHQLVWPRAPALRGVTEALLQAGWDGPQVVRPLPAADLATATAAFACNASGIWALAAINGRELAGSAALAERARAVLAQAPWQRLQGLD